MTDKFELWNEMYRQPHGVSSILETDERNSFDSGPIVRVNYFVRETEGHRMQGSIGERFPFGISRTTTENISNFFFHITISD